MLRPIKYAQSAQDIISTLVRQSNVSLNVKTLTIINIQMEDSLVLVALLNLILLYSILDVNVNLGSKKFKESVFHLSIDMPFFLHLLRHILELLSIHVWSLIQSFSKDLVYVLMGHQETLKLVLVKEFVVLEYGVLPIVDVFHAHKEHILQIQKVSVVHVQITAISVHHQLNARLVKQVFIVIQAQTAV